MPIFSLAAAGAAIGFAVTQTKGASLSFSQLPLGFGVLSWAVSFYFGCRSEQKVHSGLTIDLMMALKTPSGMGADRILGNEGENNCMK
ncbi:MAG: hypothetical protein U5K56_01995 [Halioglobus sp.]|nr:hypothetical protein [Halioglobus sp.]